MIFYRYEFLNLDTNKARLVHTTHDIGTLSLWSAQSFMYLLLKVVPEIESTTSECLSVHWVGHPEARVNKISRHQQSIPVDCAYVEARGCRSNVATGATTTSSVPFR